MGILGSIKVFSVINRLPFLGDLFSIANAYAYRGSYKSHSNFAPLAMWWSRVFKNVFYILLFSLCLVVLSDKPIVEWGWQPSETILSTFPSILGFGIGVYALMFIMPTDFLLFLKGIKDRRSKEDDKNKGSKTFGPEIVPVDMAYPLMVFILVLIVAVIAKIFPDSMTIKFITLWSLLYGLAMSIELMSFLFFSSRTIQKMRTDSPKVRYFKRKRH